MAKKRQPAVSIWSFGIFLLLWLGDEHASAGTICRRWGTFILVLVSIWFLTSRFIDMLKAVPEGIIRFSLL